MILNDSQKWLLFVGIISLALVIYLLAPVLTPFLTAALLAYLGDPLVDRLEQWKLSRTVSVSIVFVGLFLFLTLIILLLLPLLEHQLSYLLGNIPRYIDLIQTEVLPDLAEKLGIDVRQFDLNILKENLSQYWQQAGGLAMTVFSSVTKSGLSIIAWLANLILIPVVTFYLLRDWDLLVARIHELLPKQYEPVISKLSKESDETLAAFFRGQFMVMLVLGLVYSAGLWFVNLELALLIGMMAGLLSFVPYLGFIIGVMAASIAMLLQNHELFQLIPVFIVFGIGQALEGMLLTPLLVGDRIGLHPVAVIFAVLAGGQLFGFVGILLALPVAAIIAVILRHMHEQYKASEFFDSGSCE
ncbi:MAG: AI-2E family transporter [Gammaproteobacteria bacterium]|nr:AI-2E family transporter [Gammaproteobacteria bacterium]MCW9004137.1 AI-2E family transporter [Gammaproteobacteria bacterium]MCW9055212.1 AI-2E family transporter [Gammaproteobacteria bacterium]